MFGAYPYLLVLVSGLIIGSFLSSITYRIPLGKSIKKGRSFCPECKKAIAWNDNIPLLSYILLKGKCRSCRKKISLRYPLIEISTAILFFLIYYFYSFNCSASLDEASLQDICFWKLHLGSIAPPFLFLAISLLITIFVTDFEHQVIPDKVVFFLFSFFLAVNFLSPADNFYKNLFVSLATAFGLLILNLITKGKGMGLGDSKLVLSGGVSLGWPGTLVWIFLSFWIGAALGVSLLLTGKAKLGKPIAFGPFLVIGFFLTLFWGDYLKNLLFPFLQ